MTINSLPGPARTLDGPARWTAAAAGLCAVHCLLTPVFAAALPFLAVEEATEWWALAATVILGTGITLLGPARRRRMVLGVLAAGAALWCASLAGLLQPVPETVTSASGSLIFAGGMLWSAHVCRSGSCDACGPASEAPPPP